VSKHVGVSVLASGSKGNSVYIDGPDGSLIVDVGLSAREIMRRLTMVGARPDEVSGILITHDHIDHLRGVRVLAKRLGLAVYGTSRTLQEAGLPEGVSQNVIRSGEDFLAAGFTIRPFTLPHDAVDPVGYLISRDGLNVGIATDLGYATALVKTRLAGCDMLVLESNYDERMLLEGPYPWFLKQRIQGKRGHLSNGAASRTLGELYHPGLQRVVLAHLSEINNNPEAALGEAACAVGNRGNSTVVMAACQGEPTPIMFVER